MMDNIFYFFIGLVVGYHIRPFYEIFCVILKNAWEEYKSDKKK